MTTVYIVETGSYSDRCTVGVFSTRELAGRACSLLRDAYVDEFVVDQCMDRVQRGLLRFSVYSKDRSVDVDFVHSANDFDGVEEVWSNGRVMGAYVLARDEAHAIKIAADKFREFVALNPGWCK